MAFTTISRGSQWAAIAVVFAARFPSPINAQGCEGISALARVAQSTLTSEVRVAKAKASQEYRWQLVVAARLFELSPKDHANAEALLKLLPTNDSQQSAWVTLGDALCDGESVASMKTLGRLRDELPRDMARAAIVAPEQLPSYVAYAETSVQDPHSDYAVQMQTVCRSLHDKFTAAVRGLAEEKRAWFSAHILNPKSCKALALPESQ